MDQNYPVGSRFQLESGSRRIHRLYPWMWVHGYIHGLTSRASLAFARWAVASLDSHGRRAHRLFFQWFEGRGLMPHERPLAHGATPRRARRTLHPLYSKQQIILELSKNGKQSTRTKSHTIHQPDFNIKYYPGATGAIGSRGSQGALICWDPILFYRSIFISYPIQFISYTAPLPIGG